MTYGQAFATVASMLREHQPRLTTEAIDMDAASAGLMQAGWACRSLAPNLRGMLPPLPWLPPDAPIPPEADYGAAGDATGAADDKPGDEAGTDRAPADDVTPPEAST